MEYYKVFNNEDLVYGIQYQTGINIGNEVDFYSKDIFASFMDGDWIRELTVLNGYNAIKRDWDIETFYASNFILGEKSKITLDVIKKLVSEGSNLNACGCYIMNWAATRGKLDIMKYLVEDQKLNINEFPLQYAAYAEQCEMVEYLNSVGAKCDIQALIKGLMEEGLKDIVEFIKGL